MISEIQIQLNNCIVPKKELESQWARRKNKLIFMKKINVLVTCVGGLISPSQINSLRKNPEGRILRIIGTDMITPCVGQFYTDKFYRVPSGNSTEYIDKMINICSEESVDIIFPASHEEALSLAMKRDKFKRGGTEIAVSKYEVLEVSFNKERAYTKLRDFGLPCPEFYVAHNLEEFKDAAHTLGIENRKIVMKPVLNRGGRGARILTKANTVTYLLNEKPGYLEANYDQIISTLGVLQDEKFPEMILMEYLPGTSYSVDFLAKNGVALIIVPKIRIIGNASQTLVGMVKRDSKIEEDIKKISTAFGFDYNVNIELKCDEQGVALPFDFNPRIAASIAFCTAAGANLMYYALKMALGEEIPKREIKDKIMMLRYFEEVFV